MEDESGVCEECGAESVLPEAPANCSAKAACDGGIGMGLVLPQSAGMLVPPGKVSAERPVA